MRLLASLLTTIALLIAAPTLAAAQSVVNVNLTADGEQLASELGISATELANRIRTEIDEAYGTADVPRFLRSFADATSFSSRGLGVDYASNPSGGLVGVGINLAAASSGYFDEHDGPAGGVAANLALMAGLNLAHWGHPRITLFGNGFYRKGSFDELDGSITSIGGHAQIKLVGKVDIPTQLVLRWMGIYLTGGVEMTKWTLDLEHPFTTDFDVDGSNNTSQDLALTANGTFHLGSTNTTVPIELTTGFRVALLFAAYAGVGADLQLGKADVEANLTGQLRTADGARDIGTATAAVTDDNSPTKIAPRAMAGVQLNLWKLKIYLQANVSNIPAASIGLGARLVL